MLNKDEINKVKGILSAKKGTLIPKFLDAGKFRYIAYKTSKLAKGELDIVTEEEFYKKPLEELKTLSILDPTMLLRTLLNTQQAQAALDQLNLSPNALANATLLTPLLQNLETTSVEPKLTTEIKSPEITGSLEDGDVSPAHFSPEAKKEEVDTLKAAEVEKLENKEKAFSTITGAAATAGKIADIASSLIDTSQYASDSFENSSAGQAYDAIALGVSAFAPVGTAVGGVMKVAKFAQSLFGKKADSFAADLDTIKEVGSSYGGAVDTINDAASKAGKKYGLFSSGARKKANKLIAEAKLKLGIMQGIADEARDRSSMSTIMSDFNNLSYNYQINGGYDLRYMRAAKSGAKIQYFKEPFKAVLSDIQEFKIELSDIPKIFKKGGTILDLISSIKFEVTLTDPTEDTLVLKQGGAIKEREIEVIETNTTLKSVIPEGALHKNKHHLDEVGVDDSELTKKGIPVVDNDGDLLAEIELNEIIFTLEVTKELESRYKEFYLEGTSNAKKDELALEAGKLLWKEIIYNTDDRTGLIDTLKLGGSIGKKLKPSYKEWFMSIPKDCRAAGYDYLLAYNVFDADMLINHAKNPNKYHLPSVSPKPDDRGWFPFLKLGKESENPEILGELNWLNSSDPEAINLRKNFNLIYDLGRYWYSPKKKLEQGGSINLEDINKMVKQALLNLLK